MRGLPTEQSFGHQQCLVIPRSVEHHLHDAFGPPVSLRDGGCSHAEATRKRGTHAITVKNLAFDLRALDDVFRQRFELRFELQVEAEACHTSEKPALLQTRRRERLKQPPYRPK